MISFIQGSVDTILIDSVLINVSGVGYQVYTTGIPKAIGDDIKLYTYLHLNENKISLFGFSTLQEVNFFELLTSVSGVGPKVAMGILRTMPPTVLIGYIATESIKDIQKAPGVGLKTAQRLVLELKDKVGKLGLSANTQLGDTEGTLTQAITMPTSETNDAIEALLSLGYVAKDVYYIVDKATKTLQNPTTEDIIKLALKEL